MYNRFLVDCLSSSISDAGYFTEVFFLVSSQFFILTIPMNIISVNIMHCYYLILSTFHNEKLLMCLLTFTSFVTISESEFYECDFTTEIIQNNFSWCLPLLQRRQLTNFSVSLT